MKEIKFWLRLNSRATLLLVIVSSIMLCALGLLIAAVEQNLAMLYLEKGLHNPNPMNEYLDKAEAMFIRIQNRNKDDFRGSGRLPLIAVTRNDQSNLDQNLGNLLGAPDAHQSDIMLMAVANVAWVRGDIDHWFSLSQHLRAFDPEWYIQAAGDLESRAEIQAAEDLYQRVILQYPTSPELHLAYASFLELYQHDIEAAVAQYEIVANLDPTPKNLLALETRLTQVGRLDEAAKLVEYVRLTFPDYDEQSVLIETARLAQLQGDLDSAISTLEEGTRKFPKSAWVWQRLAATYEAAGHTDEAMIAAQHAIDLDPMWYPAYRQASDILMAHGRWEEAEIYLKSVLELDAEQGGIAEVASLTDLGTIYMNIENDELALQSFCRAREINRWGRQAEYIEQQIEALGGCDEH